MAQPMLNDFSATRTILRIQQFLKPFSPLVTKDDPTFLKNKKYDMAAQFKTFDNYSQLKGILTGMVKHASEVDSMFVNDLFQLLQSVNGQRPSKLYPNVPYGSTNWNNIVSHSMSGFINTHAQPEIIKEAKAVWKTKKATQLGKMCAALLPGYVKYSNLTAFYLVILYSAKGDPVVDVEVLAKANAYLQNNFKTDFPGVKLELKASNYTIELDAEALNVQFQFAAKPSEEFLRFPTDPLVFPATKVQVEESLAGYGTLLKGLKSLTLSEESAQERFIDFLSSKANAAYVKMNHIDAEIAVLEDINEKAEASLNFEAKVLQHAKQKTSENSVYGQPNQRFRTRKRAFEGSEDEANDGPSTGDSDDVFDSDASAAGSPRPNSGNHDIKLFGSSVVSDGFGEDELNVVDPIGTVKSTSVKRKDGRSAAEVDSSNKRRKLT